MGSIYGEYENTLKLIKEKMEKRLSSYQEKIFSETGENGFEHLIARIKSDESMRDKCRRKGVPETVESALGVMKDSIGIRIVCSFVDDVYALVDYIKDFNDVEVVDEKDFIRRAKPNGYRSYHIILGVNVCCLDAVEYFPVEIQFRTISMDFWAAMEHRVSYKKAYANKEQRVAELLRYSNTLEEMEKEFEKYNDNPRL